MKLQLFIILTLVSIIASQNHVFQCDFRMWVQEYTCHIQNATIISSTTPLIILGTHMPGRTRHDVVRIQSQIRNPPPIVNYVHQQWLQEFPNMLRIHLDHPIGVRGLDLQNCGRLQRLTVTRNALVNLPAGTFSSCNQLNILSFQQNAISTTVQDSFRGLTALTDLDLRENIRIDITRNSLIDSANLRIFRFGGLGSLEAGALSHMTNLHTIEMSNHRSDMAYYEERLQGLNSLMTILLFNNGLESVNFPFFSRFPRLFDLEFDNNRITTIPAGAFANGFQFLSTLSLINNQISNIDSTTFLNLRAGALFLDGNSINNDGFRILANFPPVIFLTLNNNQITDLNGVTFNPAMHILSLQNNSIDSIPPNTFANLTRLNTLRLSNNQIRRLNSNAFVNLPNISTIAIDGNGLGEIEPIFFDHLPQMWSFDARRNLCINVWINFNTDDADNLLSECFFNWQFGSTTTTTTDSGANLKFDFGILLFVSVLLKHFC